MKKVYKVVIVGTGAAGLLALLAIAHTKQIPLHDILLIDPYHDGGDLRRKWPTVVSNTTWGQMLAVVESKGISRASLPEPWSSLDPAAPTSLRHYIDLLRYCTRSLVEQCEVVFGTCLEIRQESEDHAIEISVKENNATLVNFSSLRLLLTTGAEPRQYAYPIPTIPLDIALDLTRLATYVSSSSSVMVLGTAHSGTLVLRNLLHLGAQVGAFYRSEKPFYFARDGEYDGIKQESEKIADDILSGKYTAQLSLLPITNTAQLIRWSKKADWIVYATGFERRSMTFSLEYDGITGKLSNFHHVWGFGIGFPNRAPDGIHWDVSLPAFASHLDANLPSILKSFYA